MPGSIAWRASVTACEFCEIVAGRSPARIVGETATTLSFFPLRPAAMGHTLVIPKEHIPDLWSLEAEPAGSIAEAVITMAHALRRALEPEGLNVINSTGEAASQSVLHLHVHLVPRWAGDHIGNIWPPSEPWSEEVKDETADLVRSAWREGSS